MSDGVKLAGSEGRVELARLAYDRLEEIQVLTEMMERTLSDIIHGDPD